jgi:GTP-binding protein EngB required for normal cell division
MQSPIRVALDRLDGLAGPADRATLSALRDRLDTTRLRVLVVGEAKRGKSTVVNALLGRAVLPAGVVPLTAVPATVLHAPPGEEGIEVGFTGGRTGRFSLSELPDFGTERGNPANRRGVSQLTVRLTAPILVRGLEIVDTPGTGSVHAHNTAAADAALPSMDAAIFVLTADPPVSASERELLRRVAELSVALFVVLNKADYLDEASLAEAAEFTGAVVAEATGRAERIYPVSARTALDGSGDPGFAAFAADFVHFLDSGRLTSLELSVTRQARRVTEQLLDEVALEQRAARLPGEHAAAQLAAFSRQLASVADGGVTAEDRVGAEAVRLLGALNAAADQARPVLAAEIADAMASVLGDELAAASPSDIQRRGRTRLTAMVTAAVEAWRQEQASRLENGLRELDRKLAAELEADLAAVRSAATDLLGVDLAVPVPGERLAPDLGFFYNLGEQVDQIELLAGAVRRRLPGQYGRRLARQRLLAEVPDLIASQLGRARGDLQYRLAEAARRLLADVRHRYADSTERLTAALERADRIRSEAGQHGEQQLAELAAREQALREVLGQLSALPVTSVT